MRQSAWIARGHAAALRGFDVNVALFRASIYQIHTMLMEKFSREDLKNEVILAMEYARDAEESTGQSQSMVLGVLDDVLQKAYSSHGNDSIHWSNFVLHVDAESSCDYCPGSLLAFAVMNGLTLYVTFRISRKNAPTMTAGKPLLFYATTATQKHEPKGLPHLKMIECLFQNGADANEEFLMSAPTMKPGSDDHHLEHKSRPPDDTHYKTTPWKSLLAYLAYEHDGSNPDLWSLICGLFLSHGADPSIEADMPTDIQQLVSGMR